MVAGLYDGTDNSADKRTDECVIDRHRLGDASMYVWLRGSLMDEMQEKDGTKDLVKGLGLG